MDKRLFNDTNRDSFAAAYSFRLADIHEALTKKVKEALLQLRRNALLLNPRTKDPYYIWVDFSAYDLGVEPYLQGTDNQFIIEAVNTGVTTYIQSRADFEANRPYTDGISLAVKIDSDGEKILHDIDVRRVVRKLLPIPDIAIKEGEPEELESHGREPAERAAASEVWALTAQRFSGSVRTSYDLSDPGIADWVSRTFPDLERLLSDVLFPPLIAIADVSTGVVPNVRLTGDVTCFIEYHSQDRLPDLVIGSEKAEISTDPCPSRYMEAYIEPDELKRVQDSVRSSASSDEIRITFDDIRISKRKTLSEDFGEPRMPAIGKELFGLWLSQKLLSKTFDVRIGKHIGLLLGAQYDDKWAMIEWSLSAAWVLKNITGAAEISLDPNSFAVVEVGFKGRTKFDALSWVEIGCITYELGSLDAFHKQFDFNLTARAALSRQGKLIFMGGFEDIVFKDWRCFIRTFLDQFVRGSWEGVATEIVIKYVLGEFMRRIVEGKITDAMGLLSFEITNVTALPILGQAFAAHTAVGGPLVSFPERIGAGMNILVGKDD